MRRRSVPEKVFSIVLAAVLVVILVATLLYLLPESITGYDLYKSEFVRRDRIVEACLESEKYTRQECLQLSGGSGGNTR